MIALEELYRRRDYMHKRKKEMKSFVTRDLSLLQTEFMKTVRGDFKSIFLDFTSEDIETAEGWQSGMDIDGRRINRSHTMSHLTLMRQMNGNPINNIFINRTREENLAELHIISDINDAMYLGINEFIEGSMLNYRISYAIKLISFLVFLGRHYRHKTSIHYYYSKRQPLYTVEVNTYDITETEYALTAVEGIRRFDRVNITEYDWSKERFFKERNQVLVFITNEYTNLLSANLFFNQLRDIRSYGNKVYIFNLSSDYYHLFNEMSQISRYIHLNGEIVNIANENVRKELAKMKRRTFNEIDKKYYELGIPVTHIYMKDDWYIQVLKFITHKK